MRPDKGEEKILSHQFHLNELNEVANMKDTFDDFLADMQKDPKLTEHEKLLVKSIQICYRVDKVLDAMADAMMKERENQRIDEMLDKLFKEEGGDDDGE